MRAIQMIEPGPPEVLQRVELSEPEIVGPRQLKVRLQAAGVNPIDTKLRQRGVFYPDALPAILGCDGAGVVAEVGAEVSRFEPGDRVWFCNGGLGGDPGNYAEYTLVDEQVARACPSGVDVYQAAAGPLVLITAWEALYDRGGLEEGETVLIHGGAGGVGHVAIQLAKLTGARVCTTVGTPEGAEFVRELGADEAIVYTQNDFVRAVLDWTDGRGVDVALDIMGGEVFRRTFEAMAHYGDLITLLDPGTDMVWKEARNRNLRIGFELMLTPMLQDLPSARAHQGEILDQCRHWLESGELALHVSEVLPLEQAAEAHRRLERGHTRGKIVLAIAN